MLDIKAVPTNIITGFLGAGKTTAIMHLLKDKPADERWAVLVNEFGEIGIDASLMGNEAGVYIQQVPGGCMCCAASLTMQVALNALLQESRPHRLLIEPTGLGHPKEVMQVLSGEFYKTVLDIQATITLVDARNLNDARYTNHETFNQQLTMADRLVANKVDLYGAQEHENLVAYLAKIGCDKTPLCQTTHGRLQWQWLSPPAASLADRFEDSHNQDKHEDSHNHHHHHHHEDSHHHHHQDEGYQTRSWQFDQSCQFDREQLQAVLAKMDVVRLKGVFNTADGTFGYNKTRDGVQEITLAPGQGSKVEVIAPELCDDWHDWLMQCKRSA